MELNITASRRILQVYDDPLRPASSFDSSVAVAVLVILTALFLLCFFSILIRHFSHGRRSGGGVDAGEELRGRHPSLSSSGCQDILKGLDPAAIQALPAVSYGGPAEHPMEECPICLSEFELKENLKIIPYCRHMFHFRCIETWLSSHVSCPVCRSTQLFKKVDEVRLDVTPPEDIHDGVSEG